MARCVDSCDFVLTLSAGCPPGGGQATVTGIDDGAPQVTFSDALTASCDTDGPCTEGGGLCYEVQDSLTTWVGGCITFTPVVTAAGAPTPR